MGVKTKRRAVRVGILRVFYPYQKKKTISLFRQLQQFELAQIGKSKWDCIV